jgi:oxygen-independent coproporphyrinogen III oxidase
MGGMQTDNVSATRSAPASAPDVPPEVLAQYSRPAPRYTSYPPITAWSPVVGPSQYRAALEVAAEDPADLSLYLHLPFCPQRCLYCGCNVTITRRRGALEAYLERLREELDLVTRVLGRGRRVSQLHLGGGTPNYFDENELERLWRMLETQFDLTPDADTAIEADPRLSAAEQLARLRALGFRRVSFGVQDLDPHVQRAIGRLQPADQVRRTVELARDAGFEGINVDLIYGLPEQTPDRFRRTIETLVELKPDRVACFGYAHVPMMHPHQRALEGYPLPDAVERLALNRIAIDGLVDAGYVWIGLDHFARPDDPLARAAQTGRLHRNFNGYTTVPPVHLVAVGMSAIGEVGGWLLQNDGDLGRWHAAIARAEFATVRGHRLTEDDRRRRAAIESLMCNLQLPLRLAKGLEEGLERLLAFAGDGLVERRAETVAVTAVGRYFLRTLCTAFDAYLPEVPDARPISRAV